MKMGNCCSEVRKFCTSKPADEENKTTALLATVDKRGSIVSYDGRKLIQRGDLMEKEQVTGRKRREPNFTEINQVWSSVFNDKNMPKVCPICDKNVLIFENRKTWEIAHIHAFKEGGKDSIANWRPICRHCNRSMQETHMVVYCRQHIPTSRLPNVLKVLNIDNIEYI